MEKIIISDSVKYDLDNLIKLLYKEEYFGFLDSAEDYVNNILTFIYSIPNLRFKETKNKNFGQYYCSYKHSRNTTWYATFDYENETYLIKNIANNHSKEYAKFIANIQ